MYRIRITREARADLKSISRYTLRFWGARQVKTYNSGLKARISVLSESPQKKGQSREAVLPGLRTLSHHDHYFICYRVTDKMVEILRILHQRSHWEKVFS